MAKMLHRLYKVQTQLNKKQFHDHVDTVMCIVRNREATMIRGKEVLIGKTATTAVFFALNTF